ncbi:hypothetical protein sos41_34630 [Alphaproteobacteria bacterium SO-S41]|nr:hypothetical protein sos41_34630 [Alphaproteobacteria bacterium SO-S41]
MPLTTLDITLIALLLAAVPARALVRSQSAETWRDRPRLTRYFATMRDIALLLAALAFLWVNAKRPIAWLGLDIPIGPPGLIGLAIAAALIGVLGLASARARPRPDMKRPDAAAMFPETPEEQRAFVALGLFVGIGWELLYRGYLLWALTPLIGQVAAIALAGTAYGVAHGFKSWPQFIGSIVMSLLFTVAYVATESLWWLMLIHTALGFVGWLSYRRLQGRASTT